MSTKLVYQQKNKITRKELTGIPVYSPIDVNAIEQPVNNGNYLLMLQKREEKPIYTFTNVENIILKIEEQKSFTYKPETNQTIENEFSTTYNLSSGNYLINSELTFSSDVDLFNDCNNINEVIDMNYIVELYINEEQVIQTNILDTLNPLLTVNNLTYTAINNNQVNIKITCSKPITLLKNISSIKINFFKVK